MIRINAWTAILICIWVRQTSSWAGEGPCDIYSAGGTPCVAAYSMARSLSGSYIGPLYQVRKADGATRDIGAAADGFANSADQDAFCGNSACTVSILYDQSGKANHLTKAPAGCYIGTAAQPDNESNAKGRSLMIGGHKVYALYMVPQDGYRNNKATGMPTGSAAQGIYEVADGKRGGPSCCWDFGNASTNNCNGGTGLMNSIFFGTGYWGKGAGSGPWFLGDFEAGVWSGGSGASGTTNASNPSMGVDYALGILKTNATNYAIRAGNAQSGALATAYDGKPPANWQMKGGIVLGIGGDNSNSSLGTFFEGAITAGRPTDATDALISKNIQDAGYGSSAVSTRNIVSMEVPMDGSRASTFKIRYHPSMAKVVISYTLQKPQRVNLNIRDLRGSLVAQLVDGVLPEGKREAVWEAKRAAAGIYVATLAIGGGSGWSEKIILGK